jgi:hypothetical protein
MKKRSVNPAMAMMAARALRQPAVANPPVNPMAAAAAPGVMPGGMPGMKKGGKVESMKEDIKQDKAIVKKAFKMHDKQEHHGEHTDLSKLKKGGMMKKMAKGGETMGPKSMSKDVEKGSNKLTKFGQSAVQKRGMTRGKNLGDSGPTAKMCGGGMKKMAKGGSASSRADGIASKGKTKGKFI